MEACATIPIALKLPKSETTLGLWLWMVFWAVRRNVVV
jgi:hypothetical protein